MRSLALILCLTAVINGCNKATSHRTSQRAEDEANSNAEEKDIKPAAGKFVGKMVMTNSHQMFDVVLETRIIYKVVRSTNGDVTLPISVPILMGNMSFPVLAHVTSDDMLNYSELLDPMGNYTMMTFEDCDYDPQTHAFACPYNVPEFHDGAFGEVYGKLEKGKFVGTWTSRIQSNVATFTLNKSRTENPK
jgi:hypothetical protein